MTMTAQEAARVLNDSVREAIKKRSGLFLIQGLVLAAAGLICIIFPVFMSTGVLVLLGWMLIISGAVQAISLLSAREAPSFWLQLVSVVLNILVGLLLLTNIEAGLVVVTMLLLVTFMIGGIARVVFALMIRPMDSWSWVMVSGFVAIFCSFVLFTNLPGASRWLLGLLLGLNLLAFGLAEAWLAWRIRGRVKAPPPPHV